MKRVVIANFYPVWPAIGGGQRRIFFLARELAKEFDVEIVAPERSGVSKTIEFTPSFRESRVLVEPSFRQSEVGLDEQVKMASDVAYARFWDQCLEYQNVLARRLASADVAITAHPYSIRAIDAALGERDIPVVFDSQNVECRQKVSVLKDFPEHLEVVRDIEKMALERSALTMACSVLDARGFAEEYGFDSSKVVIIENGVDALGVPSVPDDAVAQIRARLGMSDRLVAVFGGSYHHPNFRAAERILEVARELPDMVFLILGSVCNYPALQSHTSANVRCLGLVDESVKWMAFRIADIALNPMELGSGTNIKMFEYAAAGLATVSSSFGARGMPLEEGTEYLAAENADLPRVLGGLSVSDRPRLVEIGQRARNKVIQVADWTTIGRRYTQAVRKLCA
jgi:glycosyltransferase involved in cell wall biosynthesis